MEPVEKLGSCCSCGGKKNVRNVIMLHQEAPVHGKGWGCIVCHMPSNGAVAVVCDDCLDKKAEIKDVVVGYPFEDVRMPLINLAFIPFDHDMKYHTAEEESWHVTPQKRGFKH